MPETFLSAADVEVDPDRRKFSSSMDGVRLAGAEPPLAGAEPIEPDGRPSEMALRRNFRVLQHAKNVVPHQDTNTFMLDWRVLHRKEPT